MQHFTDAEKGRLIEALAFYLKEQSFESEHTEEELFQELLEKLYKW